MSSPRKPDVAIVILTWNNKKFLEQFLPSVLDFSKNEARVIIADNFSTDGSLEWVSNTFPEIEIIRNHSNKGFTGGYNDALKKVKSDYYILLNSDVDVTGNWIPPIIEFMEGNPNAVACQPKIRSFHQKDFFEYAGACGGFLDYLGYPFCRGRIFDFCEQDLGQYDTVKEIFWATGACMFIKSKAFWEAGGFDESFFAHMEEVDLCWRLKNRGYQIFSIPQSVVYHVGGGTLSKSNPKKTFLNFRNNLLMLRKNLSPSQFWKVILIRLVLDGLAGLQFLLKGQWKDTQAIIKAHFSFYRLFPRSIKGSIKTSLYPKSIVFEYFFRKKRKFSELNLSE